MANDIDILLSSIEELTSQIDNLTAEKKRLESTVSEIVTDGVRAQLDANDYGCGTANISTDTYNIKVVVSKDVKYDQAMLADLFDRIKESGQDPLEYIKVKYDVSEAAYKNWPSNISSAFEPARTVTPSKPKITFERKDV